MVSTNFRWWEERAELKVGAWHDYYTLLLDRCSPDPPSASLPYKTVTRTLWADIKIRHILNADLPERMAQKIKNIMVMGVSSSVFPLAKHIGSVLTSAYYNRPEVSSALRSSLHSKKKMPLT